jgi:hypothetical protein
MREEGGGRREEGGERRPQELCPHTHKTHNKN